MLRLAVVLALAVIVAACGDQRPQTGGSTGWHTEQLPGKTAVDFPSLLATDGDDALVLTVDDEGTLQSHLSVDGTGFESGEPLETGEKWVTLGGVARLRDGSWYALGSGGSERVDGDDEFQYTPMAFRSDDGLAWEPTEVTGFADALDVSDLVATDDGTLVATGVYRTEERPNEGGFEAHAWVSHDGRAFEEIDLPGVAPYHSYDDESGVTDVVVMGDELLAAGHLSSGAVVWRSQDGGATWERDDDPLLQEASTVTGVAEVDGAVVAGVVGLPVLAIRSVDGGRTWEQVDLPVDDEAESWAPLWSGGGRFFTLTGVDDMSWSQPEVCYADPDACGHDPEPTLVASEDGVSWTAVDADGLGELDEVTGTADGRVLVMAGGGGDAAVDVHTWPAGRPLPEADQPATPPTVELVEVPKGEDPEPGVLYHAPLYTHCGVDWLFFADRSWHRTDDGPAFGTDSGMVYGYATVGADGVLEYSLDDGIVVATYEEQDDAPGCD
ncbi:MAG TPA: hypothetical protein VFO49_04340 [Nocardioides sp.]|nr:hypothetical protein [Nocardioides sp.]